MPTSEETPPKTDPRGRRPRRRGSALGKVVGMTLFTLAMLLVMEGAAHGWRFVRVLMRPPRAPVLERNHTRYDELLGWCNVPSQRFENLYEPGAHLTTNAQGFRAKRDYDKEVPAGKIRIVCSGDSFTLGYGVDDDATWCHQLTLLDPRLETVNMGQGGYGLDQAYLWYMRDGVRLDHDVHVCSFIGETITRMKSVRFLGYPKPRLRVRDGALVTENVPVPRDVAGTPRMAQLSAALEELALYRTAESLVARASADAAAAAAAANLGDREVRDVCLAVFEDLRKTAAAKGVHLVLVYLPAPWDYPDNDADLLRYFLAAECAKRGLEFFDLVDDLRALPKPQVDGMFRADGHYNADGNRFAAKTLLERLRAHLVPR